MKLTKQKVNSICPGQDTVVRRPVVSKFLTEGQIITVLQSESVGFIIDIKIFLAIQKVSNMVSSAFIFGDFLLILTLMNLSFCSCDSQVKLR